MIDVTSKQQWSAHLIPDAYYRTDPPVRIQCGFDMEHTAYLHILDMAYTIDAKGADSMPPQHVVDHDPPSAAAFQPADTPCSIDAGDAGPMCYPPRSACADSDWQVYYDNGRCVSDQCVWDVKFYSCSGGCMSGSCTTHSSTPPGPSRN